MSLYVLTWLDARWRWSFWRSALILFILIALSERENACGNIWLYTNSNHDLLPPANHRRHSEKFSILVGLACTICGGSSTQQPISHDVSRKSASLVFSISMFMFFSVYRPGRMHWHGFCSLCSTRFHLSLPHYFPSPLVINSLQSTDGTVLEFELFFRKWSC